MSLDYDLTRIADKDVNFPADENGLMHDDLHVIIFTTMAVGIGTLTAENAREFYDRQITWHDEVGPLFRRGEEPYVVSLQQIRNAAGVSTNVSNISTADFNEKIAAVKAQNDRMTARRES